MEVIQLPTAVKAAYFDSEPRRVQALGGGVINTTYRAETVDGDLIVQRLHPVIEPVQLEDYNHISRHLRHEGWEIPALIPTRNGELHTTDEAGGNWRAFEFIESDSETCPVNSSPATYGTILGRLHKSIEKLEYKPKFSIPHFHDTQHYANKLIENMREFKNRNAAMLGGAVLMNYFVLPGIPDTPRQIIHADPKIANILTRNNAPFTFIDWDTAMELPVWVDLGDMLRSYMNYNERHGLHPMVGVAEIIEAYRKEMFPDIQPHEFYKISLHVTGRVILELTMRYLADHKDGDEGYFSWDSAQFPDRHTHNIRRALDNLEKYGTLETYLSMN